MYNNMPTPWRWQDFPDGDTQLLNSDGVSMIEGAVVLEYQEDCNTLKRLIVAAPDLLELAKLVAQDYEDAADWKDARGKLSSMARAALDKAGITEDEPEDDDDYNPHWPFK